MLLAFAGDELRADMQQFYGLNIDGMGSAFSVAHGAALAAQLPPGARARAAVARLAPKLGPADAPARADAPFMLPADEYREQLDAEWEEA